MAKVEAAHAARIWPEVNLWTSSGESLPYAVDCRGLTVHDLGEAGQTDLQAMAFQRLLNAEVLP